MNFKKLVLPILLGLSSLVEAQTLEAIKNLKGIRIAYVKSGFPFMYVEEGQETPKGFSHDIALIIAKKIQAHLNISDFKINYVLANEAERVKMLENGEIHLHCIYAVNLKERLNQVNLSTNFFYAESRFLVKKDSGIKTYGDIKDKTIASTKGFIADKFIISRKGNLKYKSLIHGESHTETVPLLIKGEVDAVVVDDFFGLGYAMDTAPDPNNYEIIGGPLVKKNYTCLLLKGDAKFKEIVDSAINESFKNGEWQKLYDKWFNQPIPPKNLNFSMPPSDNLLKHILVNAGDSPAQN